MKSFKSLLGDVASGRFSVLSFYGCCIFNAIFTSGARSGPRMVKLLHEVVKVLDDSIPSRLSGSSFLVP